MLNSRHNLNMKILILSLLPLSLFASSKKEFCHTRQSFRQQQRAFENPKNLIAFDNTGGLFNGGVCWWHSRFQRNAHYLVKFDLKKEKVKPRFYKKLIRKMIRGRKVLIIPGYANLNEFSKDYQRYIQRQLNKWQLKDGILKFAWIIGLTGKSHFKKGMKKKLEKLYNHVEIEENIAYAKFQLPGIESHAWLIYRMNKRKIQDNIYYDIHYIDSNYSNRPKVYTASESTESINKYGGGALHLEKKSEVKRLKRIVRNYCAN